MKLRWMPQALRDLDAIRRYIATDDLTAAGRWVAKLQARARVAAVAPLAGRVVPELEEPDVGEVFLRTYRIVYRVTAEEVQVLSVFQGSRQLDAEGLAGGDDAEG